jgi:hypothetical protein
MYKTIAEEIKVIAKNTAIDVAKGIINLPKEIFIDTPKSFVRSVRYLGQCITDGIETIVDRWNGEEVEDTNEEDVKAYNEWLEKYKANPEQYTYSINIRDHAA